MANLMDADRDAALRTEHLSGTLRGRSVRGGLAVLGVQSTQFALNLASTAILARLLAPEDFGLIAMASAVSNFLVLFLDLGLGSATIQRSDLTQHQASALFWINTGLGLFLAAILAGLAPLVARFYGYPQLTRVTIVLALGFVIGGVSVQPTALLRRQMQFARLAAIDLTSLGIGLAVAVGSALSGAGYWSLVYFQLAQSATAAVGLWLACGWRPSLPVRSVRVRHLLSFGAGLTTFNALAYLSRTLDNVIIGRSAGSAALGLYLKSYSMLLLPVDRVRGPASAVVVPALSLLQADAARFRSYFLKAIMCVAAVGMPTVVFLFVFAREAVVLVLGAKWQESVPLFQVLAAAAFVETFNTVGGWACTPFGKSGRLIRWQIFATLVMVACFLIGARWGVLGVAIACSVSTVVLRVPGIPYLLKGSPVSPADLLRALARPACASIAAGIIIFWLRSGLPVRGVFLLMTAAPVFGALYLGLWFVLPGGRAIGRELLIVVRDILPRSDSTSSEKAVV
jgi:O-antigen/teichoic acid export membrane protein